MPRCHVICLVLLCFIISFHACSKGHLHRPNVLFIFVDDLRTQLGCYGHAQMKTPHIDQLAAEGALFHNAFCNVPVCGASRASLLSGMRGTPTRFVNWFVRLEEDAPGIPSLPLHFKNNGYTTLSLGKVFHHADDCMDSWSSRPWRPDQYPDREWTARGYLDEENQRIAASSENGYASYYEIGKAPAKKYPDEVLAEKAIEQLRELSEQSDPFFLAVGFYKPHLPFNAPEKYWDLYEPSAEMMADNPFRPDDAPDEAFYSLEQLEEPDWPLTEEDSADVYPTKELRWYAGIPAVGYLPDSTAIRMVHGYYASVSFIDDMVGKVLNRLKELGLEENTIVVLIGDHGWHLGEHGLWCKHCNFTNVLRTPLLVKVPWMKAAGKTDALAEFVDIYPSLCELCGLDLPAHLEGTSLVPTLSDPSHQVQDAVFPRYHAGNTVVTRQYAYTEWYDSEKNFRANMLYDHDRDEQENLNLANEPAFQGVVLELREMLFETWPELKK
jgi:iduronate 2-sulfatase